MISFVRLTDSLSNKCILIYSIVRFTIFNLFGTILLFYKLIPPPTLHVPFELQVFIFQHSSISHRFNFIKFQQQPPSLSQHTHPPFIEQLCLHLYLRPKTVGLKVCTDIYSQPTYYLVNVQLCTTGRSTRIFRHSFKTSRLNV